MNLCARQPVLQALGNTEIINPPPSILLARLKPVRPPGINALFIRVKIAVRVDISRVQKLRKLASLLIRKSGIFPVRLWIFQVNLRVCHIQIPTENNRLFLLQLLQKLAEIILPLHPVRKSRQLILGVRRIAGHHIIIRVLRRNDAPFMIVLLNAKTVAHANRLLLRK